MSGHDVVTFARARQLVVRAIEPLEVETVRIEQAVGRVAAESLVAREDQVQFARAAMDGYAVRAADTGSASQPHPLRLPVRGSQWAGGGERVLVAGTAMAIATGAPLPAGADAVIPRERVRYLEAEQQIEIDAPAFVGQHVFPPAEDVRRGEPLLQPGTKISPALAGLLAFTGWAAVRVFRRPRVAIVTTGSELVPVEQVPAYGQIRNSNQIVLAGLVQEAGAEPVAVEFVPDDAERLQACLRRVREQADLIVTTGGASVGERDLVKRVLEACGAQFQFRQVALRPGKPTGFALWGRLPVLVLPGNPAAAFVGFHQFVWPALRCLGGQQPPWRPILPARLAGRAVKSKPGRAYLLLARAGWSASGLVVEPLANQCSVLVRTAAEANALIVLPEGPLEVQPGNTVSVELLDGEGLWAGLREPGGSEQATVAPAHCVERPG